MNIKVITNVQDLHGLYFECFPSTKRGEYIDNVLDFLVSKGFVFGGYVDGKLISFIIFFNYRELFFSSFNIPIEYLFSSLSDFCISDTISDKVLDMGEEIILIRKIGVSAEFKSKGVESKLISFVCRNFYTSKIISCVDNEVYLKLFKELMFSVKVSEGCYLVSRYPLEELQY